MEASLLAMFGNIISDSSLEDLDIYSCLYSSCRCQISDVIDSLKAFPLDFFPTLRTLNLSGFRNLQMISQKHAHNHLEVLRITVCPQLESLPGSMHMFPSLKDLHIQNCPIVEGGLPSNFKSMELKNCPGLVASLKEALGLETLWIEQLNAESFPDQGLLPLSLTCLQICFCPDLKKLDYKGLSQLSSLKKLILRDCPHLKELPEEGLPKSISYLQIRVYCPLLKQRYQKPEGQDWEKIAHIQNLDINIWC